MAGKQKYIAARAADIPPGGRKLVSLAGREIVIFNLKGDYYALNDRCPHEAGSLCKGKLAALTVSTEPGSYGWTRENEFIRCPWHGWEFDIRTGRSVCDPRSMRTRLYDVQVEHGDEALAEIAAEKLLVAETFAVKVEDDYLVIEL